VIEVLTLDRDGAKTLPVFSHEEEAEMFLRLGAPGAGWEVKDAMTGELVSVLYGPCMGVKDVALDPLPEMVAHRTVGLVSLLRERFTEYITTGIRRPLELCESGGGAAPREGERSRRIEADWSAAPEVVTPSKEEGKPIRISSSYPFPAGNLGGGTLCNTSQGASHSLGTGYGIGLSRRNNRC
jgi:hypothetical protein